MLHYKNLYDLFFNEFPNNATDFVALTGYVGFEPIQNLKELPFNSKIIFGLFKESPKRQLHDQLVSINSAKTEIYYPEILCHSKCYLWLKDGKPIKGMIGSANFSSNGLKNDYRESLLTIDHNQLWVMKGYMEIILNSANICTNYNFVEKENIKKKVNAFFGEHCDMPLYDTRTGQTHNYAGLNWGMNPENHTTPDDAYIPIKKEHIKSFPDFFPPKQPKIEGRKAQNEVIEIAWDDGVIMQGLLEGSQEENGIIYPKQISSSPHKNELGLYIRQRIGIRSGKKVTREDLTKYGRDNVRISLLERGVYYFDFSPVAK